MIASCFADTCYSRELHSALVLLVPHLESDLGVTVVPRSFFHRGSRIGFACRGAIASRSKPVDNDIDLFLDRSLRVGQGIPGESTVVIGEWSLVSDIAPKMSMPNEVFELVFEVMAFLRVMFVLSVEATISSFVTHFGVCFDEVRGPEEPLFSDLEEDLCSS
ncbi:hypothetical protein B296_00020391 [Ensete ventricosum]|uniref:Uncharacterized protein n=1 Tax=Ensete ventricosum TaxID=4639 RepID=A0A426YLM3_ENSVE|nr:hypothetical protein B296_00020391 [Ensete ventricosum]